MIPAFSYSRVLVFLVFSSNSGVLGFSTSGFRRSNVAYMENLTDRSCRVQISGDVSIRFACFFFVLY